MRISGLRSSTTYDIRILAENGVTVESKKPAQYTEGTYVTKSSRQTIVNTRIVKVGDSTVIMVWELANGEYIDTVKGGHISADDRQHTHCQGRG